ncbi:MAG: DUF1887 family protein [Clostridia bacterium]|nr:DUF1887 family protein [Clostridia bacterium]
MTFIEFYDRVPLHNVASTLLYRPDRVIFVGDSGKTMSKSIDIYRGIAQNRGINVEYGYRSINKNHLDDIITSLSKIIETYDDCIFDVTGGSEVYLVAVGVLMERYKGRVQCQRLRFKNSTVMDCDGDGNMPEVESFDITIKETVEMSGGRVKSYSRIDREAWTEEFDRDLVAIWSCCRKDPSYWNALLSNFAAICRSRPDLSIEETEDKLYYSFTKKQVDIMLSHNYGRNTFTYQALRVLIDLGLISEVIFLDRITFRFKNHFVKHCLTTAGAILEWYIAKRVAEAKDKSGNFIYHDVAVGVTMDWDRTDDAVYPTYNEIDVVAMRGAVPMFISCKNGIVSVEELYKLNTVADAFGKRYAKRVLVATQLDKYGERCDAVKARANDMEIRVIDNVDEMSDVELNRLISTLWSS